MVTDWSHHAAGNRSPTTCAAAGSSVGITGLWTSCTMRGVFPRRAVTTSTGTRALSAAVAKLCRRPGVSTVAGPRDRQAGDDTGERRRPVGGPLGPREHQRVVRAPGARPAGAHLQAVLALLDPPPAQRRDRVRVESHGGLGPRALRRRATSSRVLGISTSCRAIVAVPASRSTWPHRSAAGLRTMWPLSTASRHAALTVLCTSTLRADIGSSVASVPLPRRWTRFTPAWIKDLKEAPGPT